LVERQEGMDLWCQPRKTLVKRTGNKVGREVVKKKNWPKIRRGRENQRTLCNIQGESGYSERSDRRGKLYIKKGEKTGILDERGSAFHMLVSKKSIKSTNSYMARVEER